MTSLKVNGVSITNPTVLPNQFNNHFATIGPELASNIDSSNSDGYDTHLTYEGDNADNFQLHLNQDLENVHNRLRANKLTLNMTKTEFMLVGSRQRLSTLTESPTFAINDFQVSQVTTAKSLGVTIDDRLDWSDHIEKVTKKVASSIGAIKRIRHLVPQVTLQLYIKP